MQATDQVPNQTPVQFSFKETEPNLLTFAGRFFHFISVTHPKNFFATDEEILLGVETVKHYRHAAMLKPDGVIDITQGEKERILRGIELMRASTNDVGELVPKPMRMCGFVPINIPIIMGIMMAPPTMAYTLFFQWINQTYNAGMNFGNKNSSCEYTNADILKGYGAAVASSMSVAFIMRKLTAGMMKGASGNKALILNTLVGGTAVASASFCNTFFMRSAEMEKGIRVFKDEALQTEAGISRKAAELAVIETAMSRSFLGICCIGIPTVVVLTSQALGIRPKGTFTKSVRDIAAVTFALAYGLPISISVFPPVKVVRGTELENDFHSTEQIYFSKGL
jgi:hypothetical protein